MLRMPPPTALRMPAMVVEADTESAEVVAEVAESFWRVTRPVLSIVKRLLVAKTPPVFVVEPMAKRVVLVEEAEASRESAAKGEDVPRPRLPVLAFQVN